MKKKFIRRSLILLMTLGICQTAYSEPSGEAHTLEQKTFPYKLQMTEDSGVIEQEINLYFVDGGEIPHVSLEEYMPFVGQVYAEEKEGIAAVEYEIEADSDGGMATRKDNQAMMGIDADTDVLSFSNYDAFVMKPGSATLMSLVTPSVEGANGVGQADAAAFAIAWFMGPAKIALRDSLTGAQSVCMYYADINLDGECSPVDDPLPEGLNKYCLISQYSFSCANLVPASFKDFPGITLLGHTSGGGACAVLPATSAIGSAFQISGIWQIGTLKNGSFYNADTGVVPDFSISNTDTVYDREELVKYIHELP